jgi:hypothetical protein
MRFVLAFVTGVAALITIGAVPGGDWQTVLTAGPVLLVAGFFLVRNLRDPEITRRNGIRAKIHLLLPPFDGTTQSGTLARVETYRGTWRVTLDRMPEGGDLHMHDVPQRGWVWLGQDGLPERLKITHGNTWKTWPVLSAATSSTEGSRS